MADLIYFFGWIQAIFLVINLVIFPSFLTLKFMSLNFTVIKLALLNQ